MGKQNQKNIINANNTQVTSKETFNQFFDHIILISSVIFLCLVPLFFSKQIYQSFSLAKAFLLKISMGTIIAMYCVQKLSSKMDQSYLLKVKLLALPMLLLAGFTIISTVQGIDPWISTIGIYTRHIGLQGILTIIFSYFVLTFSMNQRRDIHIILYSFTILALIIGVYGVLQYFNMDFFHWVKGSHVRIPSTAGNANLLGNILSLLFPIPIYYLFFTKKYPIKIGAGLSLIFIILATIFCKSRANWLAIIASIVFYAFLFVRIHKGNKQFKFAILSSIIGSLLILQFILNSIIIERYDIIPLIVFTLIIHAILISCFKFQDVWTGINLKWATPIYIIIFTITMAVIVPLKLYTSPTGFVGKYFSIFHYEELPRYYLVRDSFHVIKKHFFWGTGEGTYRIAYMPHKSLENEIAEPKANYDSPHNNYLTVWATQGFFAFLCYISLFILIFKRGIKTLIDPHISHDDKYLLITLLTTFFSYLFWSLASFDSNVTNPIMIGLFAVFSYLIYELYYKNQPLPKIKWAILGTKILMAILIPVALISVYQAYIIFQGDINYGMGLRIKNAANKYKSPKTEKERKHALKILNQANTYLTSALKYNPEESFYNIEIADLHHSVYKLTGSEYNLKAIYKYLKLGKVHSWDPGKHYMVTMKTELTRGRNKVAIEYAKGVLKDLPHNAIVRSQLGYLQFKVGGVQNYKEAIENFKRALAVDKKNLISLVYTSEILLRFGKFNAAKSYALTAKKLHPHKSAKINKLLSKINQTQKKYSKKKSGQ